MDELEKTTACLAKSQSGLSRPLRAFPPGRQIVEVTTRTIQGRCLIKPVKGVRELVEGVIGRALHLYPTIHLYAYWFLSNHYNLLLSAPDAPALSEFMTHVNGNLARELGALFGWHERFWSRRYRGIIVVGEDAWIRRLKYLLAQGSKDGLIYKPSEWPGATSLRASTEGINAVGVWFNRTEEYNARTAKRAFTKYEFATRYEIQLRPLPCWSALAPEEQRIKCHEIVTEIEQEAAAQYASSGRRPLGLSGVLAQDAHRPPKHDFERSPAPLCHATTAVEHESFRKFFYAFRQRFRAASVRFRQGFNEAILEFPTGCILPFRPPVRTTAAAAATASA